MTPNLLDQALAGAEGFDEVSAEELFGVPIPYFCLRYFFSSNIIPCRKLIMLAGAPGTCKTSLALEFSKWFIDAQGGAIAIHTEEKWPDTLPIGLLGEERAKKLRVKTDVGSCQEWMTLMSTYINDVMRQDGLNELPMAMFVDSMCGAQGAERSKKNKKEGAPGRDFSEIARLVTDWFPDFSKWIGKTSTTAFFLLHLKESGEDLRTPGGKAKDFFSSYTLYLTRPEGRRAQIDERKNGYIEFGMRMHKDSYGPGSTYLPCVMGWEYENGKQNVRFRWAESNTILLDMWLGSGKYALGKTAEFRKIIGEFSSKNGGSKGTMFACERVANGDWLTCREFGDALEAETKLIADMDTHFNITKRKTVDEYWASKKAEAEATENAKKRGGKKKKDAEEAKGAKAAAVAVPAAVVVPTATEL